MVVSCQAFRQLITLLHRPNGCHQKQLGEWKVWRQIWFTYINLVNIPENSHKCYLYMNVSHVNMTNFVIRRNQVIFLFWRELHLLMILCCVVEQSTFTRFRITWAMKITFIQAATWHINFTHIHTNIFSPFWWGWFLLHSFSSLFASNASRHNRKLPRNMSNTGPPI